MKKFLPWLFLLLAIAACDQSAKGALQEVERVSPDYCREQCARMVTSNISGSDTLTLTDHALDSAIATCRAIQDCCVKTDYLLAAPCPERPKYSCKFNFEEGNQ